MLSTTGVFLVSLQCDVSGVVARIHANLSDATIRCEQVMSERERERERRSKKREEGEGKKRGSLACRSRSLAFFACATEKKEEKAEEKKALLAFDCARKIDDVSLGPLLDAQLWAVESAALFHCRPITGRRHRQATVIYFQGYENAPTCSKRERHKIE